MQYHWALPKGQHLNLRRNGPGQSPAAQPGSCGPPGKTGCKQTAGEKKPATYERSDRLAHPGSRGNAPPPALTEHQDVLARRQLGPGAGGHLAQDRGPAGKTAKRSARGPTWKWPARGCPSVCPTVQSGPASRAGSPPRRVPRSSLVPSWSHHRLWPSSSSLVRSPAAATAGPLGSSSTLFSTPTGAILPTAATKRALPRARRGPGRTLAGPPAARRPRGAPHVACPAESAPPAAFHRVRDVRRLSQKREAGAAAGD